MQERKETAEVPAEVWGWCPEHKGQISLTSDKRPLALRQVGRETACISGGGVGGRCTMQSKAGAFAKSYQEWTRSVRKAFGFEDLKTN